MKADDTSTVECRVIVVGFDYESTGSTAFTWAVLGYGTDTLCYLELSKSFTGFRGKSRCRGQDLSLR